MDSHSLLSLVVFLLPVLGQCQHTDDLVDKLRHFESFVELRGGAFRMGINDRHGLNNEYPVKQAHVHPFRSELSLVSRLSLTPTRLSRIFQYPVTVAAFRRYTQDKTRYRTRAELNGFSFLLSNSTNPFISDVSAEVCAVRADLCPRSLARSLYLGRRFRGDGEHSMESSRRRADRHRPLLVVPGHSCLVARCSSVLLMERDATSDGNGMGVCCTRWIGFQRLSVGRSLATETSQSLARTISPRESIARWIRSSLARRRLSSAESI